MISVAHLKLTCNHSRFPEEDDSCCIFFTAFEPNVEQTTLVLEGKEKEKMNRPVYAQKIYEKEKQLSDIVQEHSPWVVVEKTMSTSNLGGLKSLQVMQVCVRAEKQMSTVRVALLFPVTLATYVMLVSGCEGSILGIKLKFAGLTSLRRSSHTNLCEALLPPYSNIMLSLPLHHNSIERFSWSQTTNL